MKKTIRESNIERIKKILENGEEVKKLRESVKRKHGFDMLDEKQFPVTDEAFSWKAVKEKLELREADAASSFVQVLRAGVQTMVNSMYQTVETAHEDWVKVVASNKDTELYAPLHGIGFPGEVPRQSPYPETGAAGLDIALTNRKFGEIFGVEMELLADDQTSQFQAQIGLMAEYLKQVAEVYCYGKLASVAGASYAGLSVPVSETQPSYESSYPWSTALRGGGKNRPASYGALNQTNVQSALIDMMNQKNLLGLKMSVNPKRLLVGPKLQFDARTLLNSAWFPTVTASGGIGTINNENPIKGILDLTVSRFMFDNLGVADGTSKAWIVIDDSKPFFVLQMREAAAILQEAPNAGAGFERDIVRFKARCRLNADFIDPRFAYLGNDGSV